MNSLSSSKKKIKARGADAIAAISGSSLSSANNLPMLSSIAEKYAILLPIAARKASLPSIETEEHTVHTVRYGEAIDALPPYCINAVATAPELGGQMLVALEGTIARVMIHSWLGGRSNTVELDKKGFTHIDRRISARLMEKMLDAFAEAFSSILKITPRIDNVDVQAQFATVLPRVVPTTVIRVKIICEGAAGTLSIIIPRSALDPVRERLSTVVMDNNTAEGHWLQDIKKGATSVPLKINAVLGTLEMTLQDLLKLKVGSKLELPPTGVNSTVLVSGNAVLATGRTGKSSGRMGVQVHDIKTAGSVLQDELKDES